MQKQHNENEFDINGMVKAMLDRTREFIIDERGSSASHPPTNGLSRDEFFLEVIAGDGMCTMVNKALEARGLDLTEEDRAFVKKCLTALSEADSPISVYSDDYVDLPQLLADPLEQWLREGVILPYEEYLSYTRMSSFPDKLDKAIERSRAETPCDESNHE